MLAHRRLVSELDQSSVDADAVLLMGEDVLGLREFSFILYKFLEW